MINESVTNIPTPMKYFGFTGLQFILFSLFALFSINTNAQKKSPFTHTIKTFAKEGKIVHEDGQPKIDLKVHWFDSKKNKMVTDSINKQVFKKIAWFVYSEGEETETYEELVDFYIEDVYRVAFEGERSYASSNLDISTIVYYLSSGLLNIALNYHGYVGGAAHGFYGNWSLFFDPKTGKEIPLEDLFIDREAFKQIAEVAFRKQYNILPNGNINDSGDDYFWFKEDTFELPQNILIREDEVVLFYNPYEIASYASGTIIVEIPMRKVKKILKYVN